MSATSWFPNVHPMATLQCPRRRCGVASVNDDDVATLIDSTVSADSRVPEATPSTDTYMNWARWAVPKAPWRWPMESAWKSLP